MTGEALDVAASALFGGIVLGVALWVLSLFAGGSSGSEGGET